jgi:hypothetical protein
MYVHMCVYIYVQAVRILSKHLCVCVYIYVQAVQILSKHLSPTSHNNNNNNIEL